MSIFIQVIPTGTVNGTNTIFTVTSTSLGTGSVTAFEWYHEGTLMNSNTDYIWSQGSSTATVTMSIPPGSGDTLNSWLFQQ